MKAMIERDVIQDRYIAKTDASDWLGIRIKNKSRSPIACEVFKDGIGIGASKKQQNYTLILGKGQTITLDHFLTRSLTRKEGIGFRTDSSDSKSLVNKHPEWGDRLKQGFGTFHVLFRAAKKKGTRGIMISHQPDAAILINYGK